MKRAMLFASILMVALTSCTTKINISTGTTDLPPSNTITIAGNNLNLTWSDEFDGNDFEQNWVLADGERRGGFWRPDAVEVADGMLKIKTFYDQETDSYIDGCASTTKKDFLYGYYSARIRMKKDIGHWGAFWIWNHPYEIDIMEKPFTGDTIHQALHWYKPVINQDHAEKYIDVEAEGLDDGWHIYSVLWLPDRYIFFVDGIKSWELDSSDVDVANVAGELIFSDEINNGVWLGVGDIKNNQTLPDIMEIDWVRVYQ